MIGGGGSHGGTPGSVGSEVAMVEGAIRMGIHSTLG